MDAVRFPGALLVAGGRIVLGVADDGRACIAIHDAAGNVAAHLSVGETAELEIALDPGGPLVNVGDALAELATRVHALERER